MLLWWHQETLKHLLECPHFIVLKKSDEKRAYKLICYEADKGIQKQASERFKTALVWNGNP